MPRRMRALIVPSGTFKRSAIPNDTNSEDEVNFSHAAVLSLQAERLLDAIAQLTGVPAEFDGFALLLRQLKNRIADKFACLRGGDRIKEASILGVLEALHDLLHVALEGAAALH